MTEDERSGYEAVRRKLLERGYLHGPIERFVLRDLGAGRSGVAALVVAAAKAGLIGGPVLGALFCVAASFGNRLAVGPRDLGLLWIYFSVLSIFGLFLLNAMVALPWMVLARRRGARSGDLVLSAVLVGLPTLVYLGLLWGRTTDGRVLAEDLLFLALAVAIALVVAWLAGMVSLAGIIGRTGQVPGRRRRAVLLTLLVLLPLGLMLFISRSVLEESSATRASVFDVVADERRVLLVGVDGLEAGLVEAFEPRGVVSGLLSGMQQGAVFPVRRSIDAEPAVVWTSLLTGNPAREHGVGGAGSERLPGISTPLNPRSGPIPLEAALRFLLPTETVPTSGDQRRVRTLWEIVALKQPVAAVGWWASWPAVADEEAPVPGYLVSDRALPKLLAGAGADRDTLPESLFGRMQTEFGADRTELRTDFDGHFSDTSSSQLDRWLWESFLIDGYALRWAERLMADPSVRVGFVYLPGLDILRDRLAGRGDGGGIADVLATQQGLEAYVGWLDRLFGRMERDSPHDWILVADPGRRAAEDSEGFVMIVGDSVVPGCVAPAGTVLDVAPLILRFLGFPSSREMPGRETGACWVTGFPYRDRIATFGRKAPGVRAPESDFDDEMLERLKSLGYLN